MKSGGFKESSPVEEEQIAIANQVKAQVESHLGKSLTEYSPISFTSQVVAGINYLIKVKTGEAEYIHIKVHKPLPYKSEDPSVMEVSTGHTLESALS